MLVGIQKLYNSSTRIISRDPVRRKITFQALSFTSTHEPPSPPSNAKSPASQRAQPHSPRIPTPTTYLPLPFHFPPVLFSPRPALILLHTAMAIFNYSHLRIALSRRVHPRDSLSHPTARARARERARDRAGQGQSKGRRGQKRVQVKFPQLTLSDVPGGSSAGAIDGISR